MAPEPFHPVLFCFPHVSHLYLLLISGKYTNVCARQCASKAFQLAIDFPHLVSFFYFIFSSASHIDLIFPHLLSLFCVSRSLIMSRLHQAFYCSSYITSLCLALSNHQAVFFFLSGKCCWWTSTVCRPCFVSVCMCVCLEKDMLLTLWLSFI